MTLTELKEHWESRRPNLEATFMNLEDEFTYRGLLMDGSRSRDLKAKTISELIEQGEEFLRTLE